MSPVAPQFPVPARDLNVDLSTDAFAKATLGVAISPEIALSVARTASLVDSGRTRAADEELARLESRVNSDLKELTIPITGLRGAIQLSRGNHLDSERFILEALAASQRSTVPDPVVRASLLNNLGIIAYRYYRKPQLAEERIHQAITTLEADEREHGGRLAHYHRNLAIVREARGDLDGAAAAYRDGLRSTHDDPVVGLNILENLAMNREASGNLDEAESYLEAAFINLRSWREDYPRLFMRVCDDLALVLLKKSDFENLRSVAKQHATVCMSELSVDEWWRAIQPLTFVALAHWMRDEIFDAGATLRHIATLQRQAPQHTPGPVVIVGGLLELFHELGIGRDAQSIRNFQMWAAKQLP